MLEHIKKWCLQWKIGHRYHRWDSDSGKLRHSCFLPAKDIYLILFQDPAHTSWLKGVTLSDGTRSSCSNMWSESKRLCEVKALQSVNISVSVSRVSKAYIPVYAKLTNWSKSWASKSGRINWLHWNVSDSKLWMKGLKPARTSDEHFNEAPLLPVMQRSQRSSFKWKHMVVTKLSKS